MYKNFTLNTLATTTNLAKAIAKAIVPNFVIGLSANLGAGKTTLTREILRSIGIKGTIKSPTFTLVEPYAINEINIYHFDLYRFNDPEEWYAAGFDEYFSGRYICFIEWPEKGMNLIPNLDWNITIDISNQLERRLIITALTNTGVKCLKNLTLNDVI